jgi:predicted nucleic acid-binding protein
LRLVDGSIVALAESLGIRRLATRDLRHFAAVRLRDGRAFDLVVQPTEPDKS